MEVISLLQWHLSNTCKSSQLTFDTYYQRNQTAGWTEEQESQYLQSVMAGRASTPFVANTKRARARLMDGGHRLQALLKFYKNEIPLKIGDQKVFYKQVHPYFPDLHLCACTVLLLEPDLNLCVSADTYLVRSFRNKTGRFSKGGNCR